MNQNKRFVSKFNSFSSKLKQSKQAHSYFSFISDQIIKYSVKASLYSSDVCGLGDHVLKTSACLIPIWTCAKQLI